MKNLVKISAISALLLTMTGCETYNLNTEESYADACGGSTTCPSLTGPVYAFKTEALVI